MGQLVPPFPPLLPKAYQEIGLPGAMNILIKVNVAGSAVPAVGDIAVSENGILIRWDGNFWRFVTDAELVPASSTHNRPSISELSVRKLEPET